MPNNFTVDLDCWPVGQGLFMSGQLKSEKLKNPFHWVYDCGAGINGTPKPVKAAVKDYNSKAGATTPIDLLAISHFDNDHISGIANLCAGKTIKILLLPYIPLWIRFYLAIKELEEAGEEITVEAILASAHYNPLRPFEETDAQIEEILFVSENDKTLPLPEGHSEGDSPVYGSENLDDEKSQYPALRGKTIKKLTSVIFLKQFWEFVPYNDVAPLLKALLRAGKSLSAVESDAAVFYANQSQYNLNNLKQEYDSVFEKKYRNIISLFLYCGPVKADSVNLMLEMSYYSNRLCLQSFSRSYTKSAQLYTGDGFLAKAAQWNKLCKYYGKNRIDKICFLQVMHHGSQNNWHRGLAAKIQPQISMFSSNPSTYGHPSPAVLYDFSPYNPVQVGGSYGCHLKVLWTFTAP